MITNATSPAMGPPAADIRGLKPPFAISSGLGWLWWGLAVLAVAMVLIGLWMWWRKRQRSRPAPPPVPAHVRAKHKLQEALALIAQPKPFVIAVSDAARAYLEERFNFHAPERTTEEFLQELGATDLLSPQQKESLGGFLEICDLVKFAKYEPRETELRALHGAALRLVEETEPQSEAVLTAENPSLPTVTAP